jgi:hypothetical protein
MSAKKELIELCQKIKGLIPSKRKGDDLTENFKIFISDLETTGIDPYELDCMVRASNYFNVLLGDPTESLIMKRGSLEQEEREEQEELDERDKKQVSRLSMEDQIQLLLSLYPTYRAIKAMEMLADKVLTEIPGIDLQWIKGDLVLPKEPNTIMNRVSYQVEIAKQLNKLLPCEKLIEFTENLRTSVSSLKDESDISKEQNAVVNKRVTQLVNQAQEKVKLEIRNLY